MRTSSMHWSRTSAPSSIAGRMLDPVKRVVSSRPVLFHREAAAASSSFVSRRRGSVTPDEAADGVDLLISESGLFTDIVGDRIRRQCSACHDLERLVGL